MPNARFPFGVPMLGLLLTAGAGWATDGALARAADTTAAADAGAFARSFEERAQPFLTQYCVRCHDARKASSGVRLDQLDASLDDRRLRLWKAIQRQLSDEGMPPEDARQPTIADRQGMVAWIDAALSAARARPSPKNGLVRRLTVAQYRNTLRALLHLEDDLTDILPPDAPSRDGFLNNQETQQLTPLQLEAYVQIAEEALDRCIVDANAKPVIQNFRVDFGTAINRQPCPDRLVLGALSDLLENADFVVTEPAPNKPFAFEPLRMRTKYRFIEGYEGNATVRNWRDFDSIYHAVFACMRGSAGYPKGDAHAMRPEGLLLRPAIPTDTSTYGPAANFKIAVRELPGHGRFRVTVTAAKYDDGLLLDPGTKARSPNTPQAVVCRNPQATQTVRIEQPGIYQVDVHFVAKHEKPAELELELGGRQFRAKLRQPAFLVLRLPAGTLGVNTRYGGMTPLERIVFTPLAPRDDVAEQFQRFERRAPQIGVHLGLRRDCGSTLAPVGPPQCVSSGELAPFVFSGAIQDFPSPDVETNNVNYLAGIHEIGVRSEYTDGRDIPRLLIRSVEFEGPLYESWPPEPHRRIFVDFDRPEDLPAYAREIIRRFATRAFRRPVNAAEQAALVTVFERTFAEGATFQDSVRLALQVVLTAPQFLFLVENSGSPAPEPNDNDELASKLAYFLWDGPPDDRLLGLAAAGTLRQELDAEVDRLLDDPRCSRFVSAFASQWLSLDKFDVLEADRERFPRLTRHMRDHLRQEPVRFLEYLIRENLPLRNLIESEFVLANDVVASYYGLADRAESGFAFVPLRHGRSELGGVLAQAAILAGLSDGRESNPVKRGAWVARRIIAEPPDDPPPNVPALKPPTEQLTLRQRLEQHRDQTGCMQCHSKIDPWGLPLEEFDAGGRLKVQAADARSSLPDGTAVAGVNDLKRYLAHDRIDQVAFSMLKHLAPYACGRSLTDNELEFLRQRGLELRANDYRMRALIHFVIRSPLFLEK